MNKIILLFCFLILSQTFSFAQSNIGQNWEDVSQLNSQNLDIGTPSTTTFSVEIPNEDVLLVTASLCASTGTQEQCTPDLAKKVVIQFINDQVNAYKKSQVVLETVNIQ